MTSQPLPEIPDHPSLSTLARTTAIALVVAGVILVTAVLPAEYGIDPVGTGRWLGLTDIAAPPLDPVEMTRSEGAALKPTANGPDRRVPGPVQVRCVRGRASAVRVRRVQVPTGAGRHDGLLVDGQRAGAAGLSRRTRRRRPRTARRRKRASTSATGTPRTAVSPRRSPAFTAGIGRTPAASRSPSA